MKKLFTLGALLAICRVALGQDLVVSSSTLPITFDKFEDIDRQITITNTGIVPINHHFSTHVYLSADAVLQDTDIYFGYMPIYNLNPGESVSEKLYLTAEPFEPGTYNFIIVTDYDKSINETDETNNQYVIPNVVVNACDCDFTFAYLNLDKSTYTASERIVTTYTLENHGQTNLGPTPYSLLGFYLSTDQSLSADDKQLKFEGQYLILDGQPFSIDVSIDLFAHNVAPGTYYVISKADAFDRIEESNEDNNTVILPITIQASDIDLLFGNAIATNISTSEINAIVEVKNNGTTPVGGYEIVGVIDDINQPIPIVLNNAYDPYSPYIQPGETKQFVIRFYHSLAPGAYGLRLVINPSLKIAETDITNNYGYLSFEIPGSSSLVRSVSVNNIAYNGAYDNTDQELQLNLNLRNSGTDNLFVQFYTIVIKDAANTVVHSQNAVVQIDFAPGTSSIKSVPILLNTPLPAGLYTTTVACSSSCNTSPELNTLNLTIGTIQYTLTGTIQGEDGTPLNHGSLFLYQKGDDGIVKFIQKVVPTSTSDFSFQIDNHQHTLYFIPDRVDYAGYVPTIYGKTFTLQESNFFTLTGNSTLIFEILKVDPLAPGPGIINGIVSQPDPSGSPTGRTETAGLPAFDVPVILLSSSGDVVGYTHTNESGFYEFNNLPRADYQIVILRELDLITMPQPHAVTIVSRNMTVDFELNSEAIDTSDEIFYLNQVITFTDVPEVKFGQSPVALNAVSDSGLPISYSTSNSTIAEVVDGYVMINKPGSVTLTAIQNGNDFYFPAEENQILAIGKGDQTLSFTTLPMKTFGDAAFTPEITSSTIIPIELISSDPAIASISGHEIVIHGAGEVVISATQSDDDFYAAAEAHQTLTIAKASQTILFESLMERDLSEGNFELTASTNSLLSITYSSDNLEIATINGNTVSIHKAGIAQITAVQNGDSNYESAPSVTRTLTVNQITGIVEFDRAISVYPNPVTDFIFLNNDQEIEHIDAIDGLGRSIPEIWKSGNMIDFRNYASGLYTFRITSKYSTQTIRIVKR